MDSTPGGSLNDFFRSPYSQEDLQRQVAQRRRNAPLRTASMATVHPASTPIGQDTMDMSGMAGIMGGDMAGIMGGDTLDDIIMQNNKELQRRQSLPQGYLPQDTDRRASMMEFGSGNPHLNGYSFGPPTTASGDSHGHMRRQSSSELDMGGGYNEMAPGMGVAGQQMGYTTSMEGREPLSINTDAPFSAMSTEMMQNLMSYTPMGIDGMDGMDGDDQNLNTFSPQSFSQLYGTAGLDPNDFMMASSISNALPHNENMQSADGAPDDIGPNMPGLGMSENAITNSPTNMNMNQNNMGLFHSPIPNPRPLVIQDPSFGASVPALAAPAPDIEVVGAPLPEPPPKYSGIYSSSGFDMLGALMKVATRKNPEINIGKVDMSCAFVVCDMSLHDCPIIYVSDIFERLTGYNKYEVKGQNCRFLQSPEGKVEAQSKREFVDNDSVYYLKNRIEDKKEAQRSLINYRKGGQPFMNLLTMIPITGEDDKELKYFVGFQVDLVEKPHSVEGKNGSGLYTVDYSQGMLPRYVWQPPEGVRPLDGGQTISRDDVSTVLNSVNSSGETELTKRMWDKVLLENTDDVVHVLSLKGLFLYLSPSSRRVLEYDASELVGTALSSVCHPSDIVPVTRELKDTSTGAAVNVVFRIRRKKSGYTWFESHGTLCVEQGKGRKCIILVGRERPVYALHRHEVDATGGIGESEMWTKISTSGMFLFVSSNVRTLLDRSPDDLVGTSIQSLMRSESRVGFGRSLEKARTGKRVTHKHEILNKRGLVLQAQTTLYPGDASEGQKPTFLVAQTRLLKSSSRAVAPALGSNASASSESPVGRASEAKESTTLGHPSSLSSTGVSTETTTVATVNSMGNAVTQAGGSGLPIGSQDVALASEDNIFDELKTTRCTSWQFELRQMEKSNRLLAEELAALLSSKKKRKRRKGSGNPQRDCANCHVKVTPEWRRGPSGQRDLCNSCGLRWAKQTGRVSPRTSTRGGDTASKTSQTSSSPVHSSPLQQEVTQDRQSLSSNPNLNTDKEGKGNMKGEGAAVPASLGGRSTADSMPVHLPSQGFREGGERRITNIDEGNEMVT